MNRRAEAIQELRALVPGRVRRPSVTVAIAPGEPLDKITILEIKAERSAMKRSWGTSKPSWLRCARPATDRSSMARAWRPLWRS